MSRRNKTVSTLFSGIFLGLIIAILFAGGYHFAGTSNFCGSCHSMTDVHRQWHQSMHKSFACIECHMPPDASAVGRFVYKARVGLRDVYHETLRDYPAAISLTDESRAIVENNCLRCHGATVGYTAMPGHPPGNCTACHRELVHGRGLSKGALP